MLLVVVVTLVLLWMMILTAAIFCSTPRAAIINQAHIVLRVTQTQQTKREVIHKQQSKQAYRPKGVQLPGNLCLP